MTDLMLFGTFPYIAFVLAILGGIYRYFADRFSYSSLSSQFLENRALFWGSVPWHYGIILILLAHLFGTLFSPLWSSLLAGPTFLFTAELTGMALGLFTIFGIVLLVIRRILASKVLVITSVMDWILFALLTAQVIAGVSIALFYRWGSLWYLDTAVPWFWSIGRLSPNFATISPLPGLVKFHMFNAFVIIALFPFTRLVHIFTVPITYLWRPYQVVIWNRLNFRLSGVTTMKESLPSDPFETTRRGFLKTATGALTFLVGLAIGIPIIGTLVGPVFRKGTPNWAKVVEPNTLPVGEPVKLTFASQTVSAYIRETVLHNVWAIRRSPSEITVFSPICPHLGCEYNWNPQTNHFECPCHGSVYAIDGKVLDGPAPRPLDTLPTRLEKGELFIEWETFKVGIPEKIPV